ncbi:hypothetical protein MARCHEWKA_02130 [Brevundimonas phage vB_BpoS-Marchewka]|uniref:Uncharacterized protein n=1 Tax=Brevundimonas phage vB_BpoS-Marchewka TaxID=2948604 RepID=A0A9E7N463_9CAUD|nr:hypothetical protein MARCHEWKA_02130 [Brevundimonas phage vB_BpoS-Marchewka]
MPDYTCYILGALLVLALCVFLMWLIWPGRNPVSWEEYNRRANEREYAKMAENDRLWAPLWDAYDAIEAERKAAFAAQFPEYVIARATGEEYPDFVITERSIYTEAEGTERRSYVVGAPGSPERRSYVSSPPPDFHAVWLCHYGRLTERSFKSEVAAAVWLKHYTERLKERIGYDGDGQRQGVLPEDNAYRFAERTIHPYGND